MQGYANAAADSRPHEMQKLWDSQQCTCTLHLAAMHLAKCSHISPLHGLTNRSRFSNARSSPRCHAMMAAHNVYMLNLPCYAATDNVYMLNLPTGGGRLKLPTRTRARASLSRHRPLLAATHVLAPAAFRRLQMQYAQALNGALRRELRGCSSELRRLAQADMASGGDYGLAVRDKSVALSK